MSGDFLVVLVTDSDGDARLFAHTLKSLSPTTRIVATRTALGESLRRGCHLVLADATTMSPFDVIAMTRQLSPGVPVVVIAAELDQDSLVAIIRAGAADYVTKLDLARLHRVVARLRTGKHDCDTPNRLIAAQEAERRRIARDLHDSLGQQLTAIKLTLEAGLAQGGDAQAAAIRDAISLAQQTVEGVRDVAAALWPTILDELGLAAALRWLAERNSRWSGLAIDVAVEDVGHVTSEVGAACFYMAKEALTNVARHAGARRVHLALERRNRKLELEVVDDGSGFDVDRALTRPTSLGLVGMRERVALAGGAFEITSRPGSTTLRAWFVAEEDMS